MMPGVMAEHHMSPSSFKKRKRNQTDLISPADSTRLFPPTHNLNSPYGIGYRDQPKDNEGFQTRQSCLSRKRRLLQQPYIQTRPSDMYQPHQTSMTQAKYLPPNICISSSDISSPPVSPKTLVSYPQPHNSCTAASSLRPCHICHRKPTTREALNAYTDCGLCGQRACYICVRQCDSLDCGGSVHILEESLPYIDSSGRPEEIMDNGFQTKRPRTICSCCAVEGVTETGMEVVKCLECVQNHIIRSSQTNGREKEASNHML
ncbi:uncharacterized protein BDW47DRAFT_107995 [Aspergillus candidus]|uniref:Uncharacterized protein n=1 Tax=Aspergillus candidus TaxID=41067 RepID=A0A2I2F7X0_ASPCN|nr:hypothetical protein BDW47DRAFT_107995 [Aspergillus candidus]PLB36726.1 hypothetical protein BDW47DRAFT_107995 [Aspergillus candidus]